MSNTTPSASSGTDDGSHFTIEDAGSTTDPTDLFHNDTTAAGRPLETDSSGTAEEVAAAGSASGPGTQADAASSTSASTGAVRTSGSPAAVPVRSAGASGSGPAIDAAAAPAQESIPGASRSGAQEATAVATPQEAKPPVDDESIAHVFDQTNGVIEGIDGDSDGSADSEVLDGDRRFQLNPSIADAEVHGSGQVDDTRSTGD